MDLAHPSYAYATRRCSCTAPSRASVRSRHAAAYRRQLAQLGVAATGERRRPPGLEAPGQRVRRCQAVRVPDQAASLHPEAVKTEPERRQGVHDHLDLAGRLAPADRPDSDQRLRDEVNARSLVELDAGVIC
jgi:hypothetical protein